MVDVAHPAAGSTPPRGSGKRWLLVSLALIAGGAFVRLTRDAAEPGTVSSVTRVAPVVLAPAEVADAFGGASNAVRTDSPIDIGEAERWAGRIPLLDVPLPDERVIESWRLGGAEVTEAILYYADPARAVRLESLAGRLLSTGLGLSQSPMALTGADAAIAWTSDDFRALSFRRGPYVVLVGVSGEAPPDAVDALAQRALAKVDAALSVGTAGLETVNAP